MSDTKSHQRYTVRVRFDEAFEHKGVVFSLFHWGRVPREVYEQQIAAHLDRTCPYLKSAVEQTFDADEVRQLQAYFCHDDERVLVKECEVPAVQGECSGDATRCVGGSDGFHDFWKAADWNLPFRVRGYADLYQAESGYFPDRHAAAMAELRHYANMFPPRPVVEDCDDDDLTPDVVREASGGPPPSENVPDIPS
jgi:hypothetical protein